MELLSIPLMILERLDLGWTFVLYLARFTAVLSLLPGIGMGIQGLTLRLPFIIILSFVSTSVSIPAELPLNMGIMIGAIAGELVFGSMLGMIPALVIAGVQTGMQLASTSMGLGASQLIDPHSGVSVSDISRIYAEVVVVMFLMIGGHHVIIFAACGMGSTIIPGTFIMTEPNMEMLIERTGLVLHMGMIISAPIVVALLLTQFVMGLISRAVSTVNIFIISYPLTIGIGLVIAIMAFPETMRVVGREFVGLENIVAVIADNGMKSTAQVTP
jgi:flagellar biosynthesis protein FliR